MQVYSIDSVLKRAPYTYKFLKEVCKAIIEVYMQVQSCCKTESQWYEVVEKFSSRWNYHDCLGPLMDNMLLPRSHQSWFLVLQLQGSPQHSTHDTYRCWIHVPVCGCWCLRWRNLESGNTAPCMMLYKKRSRTV